MGLIFLVMAVSSATVVGLGLIAGVVAHQKGYRPWFWMLSFGLLGLLVTVLMPGLRQARTPEERDRWEMRADWTGGLLSASTFMVMFVLPVLAGISFFVRFSSPMAGPPIPPPAPILVPYQTGELQDAEVEKHPPTQPSR